MAPSSVICHLCSLLVGPHPHSLSLGGFAPRSGRRPSGLSLYTECVTRLLRSSATRRVIGGIAIAALLATASTALAQRRRGFGYGWGAPLRMATPESFDGSFNFCRIMFSQSNDGDGGDWSVDYPESRHQSLYPPVGADAHAYQPRRRQANRIMLLLRLTDDLLFQCPFIMMTEVGNDLLQSGRSRAPARVPAEGRLPLG